MKTSSSPVCISVQPCMGVHMHPRALVLVVEFHTFLLLTSNLWQSIYSSCFSSIPLSINVTFLSKMCRNDKLTYARSPSNVIS